jgi:hypothetical protein
VIWNLTFDPFGSLSSVDVAGFYELIRLRGYSHHLDNSMKPKGQNEPQGSHVDSPNRKFPTAKSEH